MISVALLTTWEERCGIYSHSLNIVNHRVPGIEYIIVPRPWSVEQILVAAEPCQVVHVSYEHTLHGHLVGTGIFQRLREMGKITVCTFHNFWPDDGRYAISSPFYTRQNPILKEFDAVVVQDSHTDPKDGFIYIPQGVMDVPKASTVEPKLGTAGFPTEAKGSLIMARVAQHLGLGVMQFMPESKHADTHGMAARIRNMVPTADLYFDFHPQEYIATRLSECLLTCWLYRVFAGQSGIAGSVRLGLAAGRPVVVSRAGMYRDLFDYEDEIYFVDSDQPTSENVLPVVQKVLADIKAGNPKRSDRIIKECSWRKCGQMYADLYRKLLGQSI
jgi:glycosyltransferase involved in cell wall biosynthesis